ncbi:hypothetical protein SAMN05216316_2952 [Nitrosovibrio sp. Nv6]|nr:hypothetical protein SAMN05216316_2952 [Nitrosovibrio sp. Nv6]
MQAYLKLRGFLNWTVNKEPEMLTRDAAQQAGTD